MVERLRVLARNAAIVGAAGSLGFMLRAGRHTPRFLLMLFIIWVLSPFVVLLWANAASTRWPVLARKALYCVTIAVALASLAIYAYFVLETPRPTPAFVLVPPASGVLTAIVVPTAGLISRRRS